MRRRCADPDRMSGTLVERADGSAKREHCGAAFDDEWQSTACPHPSFGVPFPLACPYRDETLVPA